MKIKFYQHGNRRENKISLTFDDGPNPFFTEKVLKILKKQRIRATFFILGRWAEQYPEIVEKIQRSGHIVGNHSYSHKQGDFDLAESIINNITQKSSKFIRPPYNKIEWCLHSKLAFNPEIKIVNNDTPLSDWKWLDADDLIRNAGKLTENGSIILLHDGSGDKSELSTRPKEMVKALPKIIETLKERGYLFVGLDELDLIPQYFEIKIDNKRATAK